MEQLRQRHRKVERLLTFRWRRLAQAQEQLDALSAAVGISGRSPDPTAIRGGGTGDPTARQAGRLAEARIRFERCRRWILLGHDVGRMLDDSFEGRVFDECLTDRGGGPLSVSAMARREGCSRQKVIRAKEGLVQMAAILAAERGLLTAAADGSVTDGKKRQDGG